MSSNIDGEFSFFLKHSFDGYADGSWVAIYDSKVVSSEKKLHDVLESLKKQAIPASKVLITKVKKTASYL